MHPYKKQARDNNPKWLKGLETEKVKNEFADADTKATMVPRITNPAVTKLAAYNTFKKGK